MPQSKVLDSGNGIELLKDGYGKDVISRVIEEGRVAYGESMKHRINYNRFFKKRFGIRPTITTWPWRNAANLHIPLIDKTIRRAKPKYIRLVDGVFPIVTLKSNILGDNMGIVRGVERKFDELMRDKMEIVEKSSLGIDKMLERGYFIGKVVQEFTPKEIEEVIYIERLPDSWKEFLFNPQTTDDEIGFAIANRYEIDVNDNESVVQIRSAIQQFRSGLKIIRFKRTVDQTEFPSLYVRDPIKVITPYDTTDIRYARLIWDRMTMTENSIEEKAAASVWDKNNVYELLNRIGSNASRRDRVNYSGNRNQEYVETLENIREGVYPTGHLPDIDETYFYFKWPGDMLPTPSVLTMNYENPDLPLRFIKYPYVDQFGNPDCWPFAQVTFEKISDRFHSPRGIPQMLDSLQTEITNNHNAKQNHMAIATSLNIKAKRNSNISTNWVPGQPIWLNRMDDLEVLQIQSKDVSFDNEERSLLQWAESYMGLVDNPLTQNGPTQEPRTKFEVEKLTDIQDDVAYGDTVIFQTGMNKIYNMVWNRWMQYGPNRIMIQSPSGDMIPVEKEELIRRFRLIPTGNISNSSISKRKRDSILRLQMFNNDPFINQHELRKQALMLDDERAAETLLLTPAQIQENETERQIQEISMMNMGYQAIPKLSDNDDAHIKVIDDFLNDPIKVRNLNQDRIESILNHRQAHLLQKNRKERSTTKNGRLAQEVANVSQGIYGRAARNATSADKLNGA